MNDNSIDRDSSGVWDRVWRGRASSHRRGLANVAAETARVAILIAEGARLVDRLPAPDRQVEILGVCDEIDGLIDSMRNTSEHLRAEAGDNAGRPRSGFWARLFGG